MSSFIKSIFILLGLIVVSCGTSKELDPGEKLPRQKDEVLLSIIDSLSKQRIQHFYSKIGTDYKDSTRSNQFKTSIRLRSDSVLNALITFANVPIINSLVTTDSVFVSNRKDKCYMKESMDYLRKEFGISFNLRTIEEFILGLPLGYDSTHQYEQIDRTGYYTLSSHKKKEIRKQERKDYKEMITMYALSADLRTLDKVIIESPADTAHIEIHYLKRELVGSMMIPKETEINIRTPRNNIRIQLDYNKTKVDETEAIYFVIPEEYEPCN